MSHDEALVDEVAEAIFDVVVDHPMWLGDDGEPLDYNPDREARICDFAGEAARAALDALDVPGLIRAAKAEALRGLAADLRIAWGDGPPGTRYYGALQWFDPPARNIPLKEWLLARAAEIDPEEGDHGRM